MLELVARDRQRRRQPEDASRPAVPTSRPAVEAGGDDRAGRTVELGAEHQAAAAHLDDARQRVEPGREPLAAARARRRAAARRPSRRPRRQRRTTTGLPPNVLAWSPGSRPVRRAVRDEQRADRQAVGEPLRERDARPARRRAAPRRRSVPVRPTPHCTSSKTSSAPCSSASARAAARNSASPGGSRPRPEPARSGSRPCPGRPRAASESTSFRRANRAAGASGSHGRALLRLAGDGERAVRAAVERVLQRDDDRLAGRLPRPLQRRLDRLGAGVAEERAGAAEAIREQAGELAASARSSRGSRRARACRAGACAAASGAGWQWPRPTTAIPPSRSR